MENQLQDPNLKKLKNLKLFIFCEETASLLFKFLQLRISKSSSFTNVLLEIEWPW